MICGVDRLTAAFPCVYQDANVRIILFGFAAGQELSEHTTPMVATLHFLAGQATVTLGEKEFSLGAGGWVQMPPKLPHSVRAQAEPVLMILTMVTQTK